MRELRQRQGWTQAELAERAGVTRVTVTRLETRPPKAIDLETLERLANAFSVDAGYLIVHEASPGRRARG